MPCLLAPGAPSQVAEKEAARRAAEAAKQAEHEAAAAEQQALTAAIAAAKQQRKKQQQQALTQAQQEVRWHQACSRGVLQPCLKGKLELNPATEYPSVHIQGCSKPMLVPC